jgi:polyhydroxybutyrate depolymerase
VLQPAGPTGDLADFLAALIDHLSVGTQIDRSRVYSTGISNGGLMSLRLARELSARIAARAVVAVNSSEQIARMRDPSRPISALLMPGTRDPLVPWDGGDIGFPGRQKVGQALSVQETLDYWVTHNQCPPSPAVAWEPDRAPGDGTRVRREPYGPCREGSEVALYAVEGGGHTWPGGYQYLPERLIGRTSRDMDASDVIWEFFRRHSIT